MVEVRQVTDERVTNKIAQAFLRQRFPLSKQGEVLRAYLDEVTHRGDPAALLALRPQLPTVEAPQLHLFAKLRSNRIFESPDDIKNIQVTKGCSHGCDFCAIDAFSRVEAMPYVSVLKIAQSLREAERPRQKAYQEWQARLTLHTGVTLAQFREASVTWANAPLREGTEHFFDKFAELSEVLWEYLQQDPPTFLPVRPAVMGKSGLREDDLLTPHKRSITNYYDSDPFDYRDTTILHQDGTPADYGDVFTALASPFSPIHITTAGWRQNNAVAKRAAQKIAQATQADPALRRQFRLSVNMGELTAKQSLDLYLDSITSAARELFSAGVPHDLNQILLFADQETPNGLEFEKKCLAVLSQEITKNHLPAGIYQCRISRYSGRNREWNGSADHDVMACMPGYHIWPNGSVMYQDSFRDTDGKIKVRRGTRPQPTGDELYRLPRI
ncbi:hypothetical protein A2631_02325 [Candidatus Daviesbacteria bacterium RIFCSPHIGHO2_01_FULL_44_29]|uniref:Uncharacterized protein n=1 Tax=Candidatus Daviesbacteria bacterium RIFCSPHIGHO2_02_FULL_43_12 TaxID=1797776 RepID=A0A1F5KJY5_9BACT|nr:MAG: hypothetical protein A2631_02325 [Candidatus Daviesbacteria bacterium RIFCSPHIGHO2_01_FULL_44_29]OGE40987.1 MAG: hypothetical protein A3E86_03630 [Candidatus Daviesbacteria bacterium RIFCSPHIGHO2_12_FULL_47_45]OGE41228.1 MAG: hypothetical protein A3D25_01720 [Candidatus Daviesbacteria bacterium RIFCSPHIGHO2_02_FULL_43_12]OGE69428.1 MAG: hypothetical protein A3B55_03460 [Candidatus Daviesbacteria bacterium RIFCSPLOWO2_01_FULL_43_15]